MKTAAFILILSCFTFSLNAQIMAKAWEKHFGQGGQDKIHQVIQATNGHLIAVGESSSAGAGGADGYLIIADYSTGNLVAERRFGGRKDDVFRAVVQLPNGLFILAGSTESQGQGKKDAWLLVIDEEGNRIWEKTSGGRGDESWQAMARLPNGKIALTGFQDDHIRVAQLEGQELSHDKTISTGIYENVKAIAPARDNGFVITGYTNKSKASARGDIYLAKLSATGELSWQKFFGGRDWEEAMALIPTRDGGFAISGLTRSQGAGDLDAWLIKVSQDGFQQWEKTYGGKDADQANALIQTPDGGFLIGGSTKSHRSGARQWNGFVVKTDAGGALQWEQNFGGDDNDEITAAALLNNESVVFGGFNASGRGGENAWLIRLDDPRGSNFSYSGARGNTSVEIKDLGLQTSDRHLRAGERSHLLLELKNTANLPLRDLKILVDQGGLANSGIDTWSTNLVGRLEPFETRTVAIPVRGTQSIQTGQSALQLTARANGTDAGTALVTIKSRETVTASLEIASYQFIPSNQNDDITLAVNIRNPGDFPTQMVDVNFICPAGFTPKGADKVTIGRLLPRNTKPVKLVFTKTAAAKSSDGIVCIINENGKEWVRKTLTEHSGDGLAKGPLLIWTDPAPHELGTNRIRRSDDVMEFKMTIVSSTPLQPQDFRLRVNGSEMEGSKFNEQELSAPTREKERYTYTYRNKVPLTRGKNVLQVVAGNTLSDLLEVTYEPKRLNLHVLAIGPQHPDLKFTANDANDFASIFEGQGGPDKLFAKVIVNRYNTPEATTLTGIQQAMYDLVYQYKDQLITPNDMLIVFISSHGKISGNRFKILQSNYNPKYEQISVDFKEDILESLKQIDCKKLVFLDACHSGAARSRGDYAGMSKALIDLAKSQPGLSTLTSCRSTELSYEHDDWKNGAFTEALLEAFNNEEVTDERGAFRADINQDNILRLGELYDFLQRRVPELVKSKLPNAPTQQVPFMPEEQLDRDMPIFYLGS